MPIKDPEKRRAYHRKYIRERYANDEAYRSRHKTLVKANQDKQRTEFKEWVDTLSCSNCDEDDSACLEFHHRDPSQKEIEVALAVKRGWGRKKLQAEIAKCDVLCANCHRKLHRDLREL